MEAVELDLTNVAERNKAILEEMTEKEKQGFKYGETAGYLRGIADKYGISFNNAQSIYYNKVKARGQSSDNKTESVPKKETKKQKGEDNLKEIVYINGKDVRIILHEGELYVVAKDLLFSIGIKSTSSHLNTLLTEEERVKVPVMTPNGHGPAQTLVLGVEIALTFLEIVSTQHVSVKIGSAAKKAIPQLKKVVETLTSSDAENTQEDNQEDSGEIIVEPANIQKEKSYKPGDKIDVKVTNIGPKVVVVETIDGTNTQGTIYIADVADMYVQDLNDFFKINEVVQATIRSYDDRLKRLSLTTVNNPNFTKTGSVKTKGPVVSINNSQQNKKIVNHSQEVRVEEPKPTIEQNSTVEKKPTMEQNSTVVPALKQDSIEKLTPETLDKQSERVEFHALVTEMSENGVLPALSFQARQEFDKIIDFLNNRARLGVISPAAKAALIELLNTEGFFDVIMGMTEIVDTFKPDLGLMFMQEVKEKLKGGHL